MVVVVKPPTSFRQTQEQLTIEPFLTKLAIEALHETIFPWATWRNEQCLDGGLFQPFGQLPGQAFSGEFIDHLAQPDHSSVFKPIGHEIVRPNVILVLGTSTDATVFAAAMR